MANSCDTRATAIGEHAASRIERLLVVDDEPEVARIIERVAEQLGFQMQSLSDSMRFEAHFQAFTPSIIFVDINMPGRDGLELIACLAASNYQGKIVIMSGYDPQALPTAAGVRVVSSFEHDHQLAEGDLTLLSTRKSAVPDWLYYSLSETLPSRSCVETSAAHNAMDRL